MTFISLSRFFLLRNRNLSHEIFSYLELNYFFSFLKLISAFFSQHLIAIFFLHIFFLHNSHTRIISFVITNMSDDEVAEQIYIFLSFKAPTTRYGLLSLSAVSRMKILFRMNMCWVCMCLIAMFHYRSTQRLSLLFVQSIHF